MRNQSTANRRNLYVAYYARTPRPTSPGRYHTALIVLPDPSPSTTVARVSRRLRYVLSKSAAPEFESKTASKYHVVNVPVADERGKGRISWELRVEKDDATVGDTPLRMRLVALMLVGVIEPRESLGEDQTVEEIVRNVDIPKYAEDRPEWRCTTWVFEALKLLNDAKRIPELPSLPIPDFWHIGNQFSDKWRSPESVEMMVPGATVPCCDREGNEIPSPLGAGVS
ncbi:hypothetical protein F5887DRAFT_1238516 [Amanita rubescens]|nr:hypothetical protein F5887DRAFT_1238516 [Amanita rubescens]